VLREVLGFDFEEAGDDGGGLLPVLSFGLEGSSAGLGEAVKAGTAIVVGGAPLGFDGAFLFELQKDRIKSALVDGQEIATDLLDAAGEAVAVERPEDVEGFEDHQGESALEDVGFFVGRRHLGIQQKDDTGPFGKQQELSCCKPRTVTFGRPAPDRGLRLQPAKLRRRYCQGALG